MQTSVAFRNVPDFNEALVRCHDLQKKFEIRIIYLSELVII